MATDMQTILQPIVINKEKPYDGNPCRYPQYSETFKEYAGTQTHGEEMLNINFQPPNVDGEREKDIKALQVAVKAFVPLVAGTGQEKALAVQIQANRISELSTLQAQLETEKKTRDQQVHTANKILKFAQDTTSGEAFDTVKELKANTDIPILLKPKSLLPLLRSRVYITGAATGVYEKILQAMESIPTARTTSDVAEMTKDMTLVLLLLTPI